jgi:hypothetical protein
MIGCNFAVTQTLYCVAINVPHCLK